MKTLLGALVLLSISGNADAESADTLSSRKFAQCVVVETSRSTTTAPVPGRAVAGCQTGGGGVKSCTVDVGPNNPDYVLNTTIDLNSPFTCFKLDGDNPCAFVQAGPIIFTSERSANRTFTTNSDRVQLVQEIPQLRLQETFQDSPQSPRTLYTETKFSVAIKKSTFSARLECTLINGDQEIYPLADGKDLSDKIKFVSQNTNDPVLKIITYQVGK